MRGGGREVRIRAARTCKRDQCKHPDSECGYVEHGERAEVRMKLGQVQSPCRICGAFRWRYKWDPRWEAKASRVTRLCRCGHEESDHDWRGGERRGCVVLVVTVAGGGAGVMSRDCPCVKFKEKSR